MFKGECNAENIKKNDMKKLYHFLLVSSVTVFVHVLNSKTVGRLSTPSGAINIRLHYMTSVSQVVLLFAPMETISI